jgi:hypothetical protein
MNIVVPFGDYACGQLHFPALNVSVDIQLTDTIFFKAPLHYKIITLVQLLKRICMPYL